LEDFHVLSHPFKMRFLIFGVGAIGTYIGCSLLLSGYPVAFIECEPAASQVKSRGLRLQMGAEERTTPALAVYTDLESALQVGAYDVAIVAVKSFDTLNLAQMISRAGADFSAVLSVQNGVENERLLATHLGQARVIAGAVTSAIRRIDAGNVVIERQRGIGIAADHPLSEEIMAAFNDASLNARLYENPQSMKWSKMLTNLLANASSAILDMTPAEIFAHRDLYALEVRQIREALQVMAAMNVPVTNLPGAPVRSLMFMMNYLPVRISQPVVKSALGRGRGGKMPSLHVDLHGGKTKSEVDYLNGVVVRYADQLGIRTPVNKLLNDTLLALIERKLNIVQFAKQPGKLLALLKEENI